MGKASRGYTAVDSLLEKKEKEIDKLKQEKQEFVEWLIKKQIEYQINSNDPNDCINTCAVEKVLCISEVLLKLVELEK